MLDANFFADLRKQHRVRASMLLAETTLTLQVKALCRVFTDGDLEQATILYEALQPQRGSDPGEALFELMASGKSRRAAARELGISDGTARWWDEKRRAGEYQPAPTHLLKDRAKLACDPFLDARATVRSARVFAESRLEKLAEQLPASGFVRDTRGLGLLGLAQIVGECGDFSQRTVPQLWARMGLAVMPDGTRQRRMAGPEGITHRFSTPRRMIMWNIGVSLIRSEGPYKAVYDERKAYETGRGIPQGHAHNRAKRYIEKRLLRDLWRTWRDAKGGAA